MKNYLEEYIKDCEVLLKEKVNREDMVNHLNKISFFQHERFIHLIVTIFFAMLVLCFLIFSFYNIYFVIITFIVLIILIFYIRHYFFLENGVQELYKIYDKMNSKVK